MRERRIKDGRPTGVKGRISAQSIRDALGLGGPEPETRPPKLTPAQVRAKAEGKPIPEGPPDYETTVIKGGRDAWEYLGRPDVASPPPGSPDGTPVGPEFTPREKEPAPVNADWDAVDQTRKRQALEREFEKAQADLKKLLQKEAEAEVARQRRKRRAS